METEIGQNIVAPAIAIGAIIAAIKTAIPAIPSRVTPLFSLGLGLAFAFGLAATTSGEVDENAVNLVLLGIGVGLSASGIQATIRSQGDSVDRLPGTNADAADRRLIDRARRDR